MMKGMILLIIAGVVLLDARVTLGANWPGFRGPLGNGVSTDKEIALTWSETENLHWKVPLPGPGSSSPIVWGDRVFVTCYSGYGTNKSDPGDIKDLKRQLLCVDRNNGKVLWDKSVDAVLPEDAYRGYIQEHGYASNTPVCDGEVVYVFFGKIGVLAFDLEGREIWRKNLGTMSSNRRWGSAASPILYDDLLIVNASEESRTIYALDKRTGQERWKVESDKTELSFITPTLVDVANGEKELVLAVPFEVWGFNPKTGECTWWAQTRLAGNISPSVLAANDILYAFGGYPRTGGVAIRAGGKGDVTQTHILWSTSNASYIPSPVFLNGNLYWVSDRGIAYCMDAKTSRVIYKRKLPASGGKPFYASVVLADDKLYAVSRKSGTFVLGAKPEFEQLAHNRFESDDSDFNGSPAVSDGQLFLRSNQFLYCIGSAQNEKTDTKYPNGQSPSLRQTYSN